MVEAMAPQLAADLKREAGHEDAIPSLAMAAAMAEGTKPEDLTGKLADEFKRNNPDQAAKLQKGEDERLLGWLDSQTEKSQRRRMGDDKFEQMAEVNRQQQAAMDESRVRASELQTRIRDRQAAERRMRPSLLN